MSLGVQVSPRSVWSERSGMQAVPDVDCLWIVHQKAATAAVRILNGHLGFSRWRYHGTCASRTVVQLVLDPIMNYRFTLQRLDI